MAEYYLQNNFIDFQDLLLKFPHQRLMVNAEQHNPTEIDDSMISFVISGRVVSKQILANGNWHTLLAYGPGSMFPLMTPTPAFSGRIAHFAVENTVLWRFAPETIDSKSLQDNLQFQKAVQANYRHHLTFLLNDIEQLLTETGLQRLAGFLLYYLHEHQPEENRINVSQKDIGALIGINPVNMSRNLKKLKNIGAVELDHGILRVKDEEIIQDIANGRIV